MESTDALARDVWLSIVRIFRSPESTDLFLQAAEAEDLSIRLMGVLLMLSPHDGKPMSQLAEECFTTASYMTVIVDGLEERGLAERHVHPDDRRVKLVTLTDDGLAAVHRSHERMAQPPSGITALTRDELTNLRDLLTKAAAPYPW